MGQDARDVVIGGQCNLLPHPNAPGSDTLTDLQSAFVDAFILLGGNSERAALEAGYGGGAANMGLRNLAKPKVQVEIVRRLKLQSGSALATALGALFKVIEDAEDPRAVVQAALGIMDRFGMAPPRGPAVAIQVNNIGGDQAQAILTQVMATRAARLAGGDGA